MQHIFLILLALLTLTIAYLISGTLVPFIISIVLAYLLRPVADHLSNKYKIHDSISSLLVICLFIFIVLLFFSLLGPLIYEQIINIINQINNHSDYLIKQYIFPMTGWLEELSPNIAEQVKGSISNVSKQVIALSGSLLHGILKSGMVAINTLSIIFITPVVTFYLIRDWNVMQMNVEWLVPMNYKADYKKLSREIGAVLKGFFRGQVMVCSILAIYYTISFLLVDLHSGLALGILSGILVFIPYLGAFISTVLCFIVALLQFGLSYKIFILVGILLFGQLIEGMIITPKLIGNSVGLHPVWIIFSLLAAGALFGFWGVVVAVPCAALVGVVVKFYLKKYKGKDKNGKYGCS